mmetsp:Transcript_29074/g.40717  ORF Transcript_29074/g.40717 Transcript_29074/m.40717 type:complete len:167 (-) Transcript_29074:153-653(-)
MASNEDWQAQQQQHDEQMAVDNAAIFGEEDEDDEDDEDAIFGEDKSGQVREADALLMRFCPHDSSMLYPQEDKRNKLLKYACRLCRYSEVSSNPLIFRNLIKKEVKNVLTTIPSAVSDDPTLARSQNANCENCGHHEAVFFQSDSARTDTLALIFVCCNCDHKWVN